MFSTVTSISYFLFNDFILIFEIDILINYTMFCYFVIGNPNGKDCLSLTNVTMVYFNSMLDSRKMSNRRLKCLRPEN